MTQSNIFHLLSVVKVFTPRRYNDNNLRKSILCTLKVILFFFITSEVAAQNHLQIILDTIKDGRTVYINESSFTSDDSYKLINKNNVTIVFDYNTEIFCTSKLNNVFEIENCKNINIYGGKFKHNTFENEMCVGAVFSILNSSNIYLTFCDINGSGSIGVSANKTVNLNINSCSIHDNSSAAYYFTNTCSQIYLLANRVFNNGASKNTKFANWDASMEKSIIDRSLTPEEKKDLDLIIEYINSNNSEKRAAELKAEEIRKMNMITEKDLEFKLFPADFVKVDDGYTDELWLLPSGPVWQFYNSVSGLVSFNPKTSFKITRISESAIRSISPKAFVRGIQEDQLYLTEYMARGISYSFIPELEDKVSFLRSQDVLEIATQKNQIINDIIKIRQQYLIADLKYRSTRFVIPGKCYAKKANYNIDTQELDLQLSIDYNFGKDEIYIATVRTLLSLADAQKFFSYADNFTISVSYKVSPGSERKNLGLDGGGVAHWNMPNLFFFENPIIDVTYPAPNDFVFKFKTAGLKGELWTPAVNTTRWDLNKPDEPYYNYDYNTRIIQGITSLVVQKSELISKNSATEMNTQNLKDSLIDLNNKNFTKVSNWFLENLSIKVEPIELSQANINYYAWFDNNLKKETRDKLFEDYWLDENQRNNIKINKDNLCIDISTEEDTKLLFITENYFILSYHYIMGSDGHSILYDFKNKVLIPLSGMMVTDIIGPDVLKVEKDYYDGKSHVWEVGQYNFKNKTYKKISIER